MPPGPRMEASTRSREGSLAKPWPGPVALNPRRPAARHVEDLRVRSNERLPLGPWWRSQQDSANDQEHHEEGPGRKQESEEDEGEVVAGLHRGAPRASEVYVSASIHLPAAPARGGLPSYKASKPTKQDQASRSALGSGSGVRTSLSRSRRCSKLGGSERPWPRVSSSSSAVKPGPRVAISNRTPEGSRK